MTQRFSSGSEVWTDGRAHTVAYANGVVAVYDQQEVVTWVPKKKKGADPPPMIFARWCGWPEDAADGAGAYLLRRAEERTRLEGEVAGRELRVVPLREEPSAPVLPGEPRSLSSQARLHSSPRGVLVSDVEVGLIWSPAEGVAWRLSGVGEAHRLFAVRVAGGLVVHLSDGDGAELLRISEQGEIAAREPVAGQAQPLGMRKGRVYALVGDRKDTRMVAVDPRSLEQRRLHTLPGSPWSSALSRHHWLLAGKTAARLFRFEGEALEPIAEWSRPRGKPDRRPAKGTFPPVPLSWSGGPGFFRVETSVTNRGRDLVGPRLRVETHGPLSVNRVRIGEMSRVIGEEDIGFPGQRMATGEPVPVVITGKTAGPGGARLHLGSIGTKDRWDEIGVVKLDLDVEGGLRLVRDDETLPLDPNWIADLARIKLLDASVKEPDLDRWVRRALSRARVRTVDEDPERVRATFLQLTAGIRATTAPSGGVPRWKLGSGGHWIITEEEAGRIAHGLGTDHPLGAFAAGGSFTVEDPDADILR